MEPLYFSFFHWLSISRFSFNGYLLGFLFAQFAYIPHNRPFRNWLWDKPSCAQLWLDRDQICWM